MSYQATFDFTHPHNNVESAERFDKNKDHFNKQCRIVYDALMRGERLTTSTALIKYQVGDLRRRIKDLIDYKGLKIESQYVPGTRYKEYYIEAPC